METNIKIIGDRENIKFRDQVSKNIERAYAALKLLYPHRAYLSPSVKKHLCNLQI